MVLHKKRNFQKNSGMKLNKLKALQLFITAFISSMMIFCMISLKEYYPFAPYTMYSYAHRINGFLFYDFYCEVEGRRVPVVNEMISPLDEARLKTSIGVDYLEKKNFDDLRSKLINLKELIIRNNFQCDDLLLDVVTYESVKYLLDKKPVVQKSFQVGQ